MSQYEKAIKKLCALAGVQINGDRDGDPQVHNPAFYKRVLGKGSLGLGESYMEGWWDCDRLDIFFEKILSLKLEDEVKQSFSVILASLQARLFNLQLPSQALKDVTHHYDIGNDLFELMLDKRLVYSCGYWENASNVDEAQEAKLKLSCDKLKLEPGEHLLDIGCGWGSMAKYAAENYGVRVTGITLSDEQIDFGRKNCAGLDVELKKMDYRSLQGSFDKIVSIGMFEHVGYKNYRRFFEVASRNLKENGLFLLHTIGATSSSTTTDPWLGKYIFPHSLIPSLKQIFTAKEELFVLEDLHNFGPDYDKTLMAWYHNFEAGWDQLRNKYGETFYRMWRYYLLCCAASFRVRKNNLWQMVLSEEGLRGGYESIR